MVGIRNSRQEGLAEEKWMGSFGRRFVLRYSSQEENRRVSSRSTRSPAKDRSGQQGACACVCGGVCGLFRSTEGKASRQSKQASKQGTGQGRGDADRPGMFCR